MLEPKPAVGEDAKVEGWRIEQLLVAGYPERLALELALRPDIDLHQAVELLRRGCPPETAGSILI